jgi:hypothetical protein
MVANLKPLGFRAYKDVSILKDDDEWEVVDKADATLAADADSTTATHQTSSTEAKQLVSAPSISSKPSWSDMLRKQSAYQASSSPSPVPCSAEIDQYEDDHYDYSHDYYHAIA